MARVTETILFKNISPFIKSISKRQLAHELVIVKTKGDFYPNESTLSHAMVWDETPQGFAFWSKLNFEYWINAEKKYKADIAELV